MPTLPTLLLALILPLLGQQLGPQLGTVSPDSDRSAQHRVIDHRMTIEGQEYAWSVMIPAGVEPGGAAILFLHGYGESGTDGKRHLTVGLPPAIQRDPERWPFVVIAPQKPIHNTEWEDHEPAVLAMLEETAKEGLYDPGRLAITGLSQGGHGTIAIGGAHADRFRAAAPVCAYTARRIDDKQQRIGPPAPEADDPAIIAGAERLKGMPVWLFHGVLDKVIPVEESRVLHDRLERLGADTRYTELPTANHNAWDDAYANASLAAWFVTHTE